MRFCICVWSGLMEWVEKERGFAMDREPQRRKWSGTSEIPGRTVGGSGEGLGGGEGGVGPDKMGR
jgi:hypothetical protein